MEYAVDSFRANVNTEQTKSVYRSLSRDTAETGASLNFRKNLFMRKVEMEAYLAPMGIDVSKYQDLFVVNVNQPLQSVTYCGYYPICTENEAELKQIVTDERNKKELHINKTEFGFEFSIEYVKDHIVLFFWAELPWLFEPPIPKSRYENKTALPRRPHRGF